jgi:hypothetical protein
MTEELQRRNYTRATIESYILAVKDFAQYFGKSPMCLGSDDARRYQLHLINEKRLAPNTVKVRMSALRFFYWRTLKRRDLHFDDLSLTKTPVKLSVVLSPEEVARLIEGAANLKHRTMLMVLYATGLRRAELARLKVSDIDSKLMVIHIREAKPLYGVVASHLETSLARHRNRDNPVPPFVERELRSFLDYGVLAHGFLRVHCDTCGPHASRPAARASSLPVSGSQGASHAAGDSSPCVLQFPAWRQESPDLSGEVNVSSQIGSRERPGEASRSARHEPTCFNSRRKRIHKERRSACWASRFLNLWESESEGVCFRRMGASR